jgi:adenosylcobinamide kinase/adenosylcobinamide-phosphate guanylyltransferase
MALKSPPCSIVLVSNEVGSGVVPAYPSGRRFRDLLGEMNQSVARVASNVLLLVAGLPLVLKGQLEVSSAEAVSTNAPVSHEVSPEVSPEVSQ